jgi:hypothetical protein
MDNAFTYLKSTPLEPDESYPYKGKKTLLPCWYFEGNGLVCVKEYVDVTPNNSADLKAAIAKQPVSVAV